MSFVTRRHSRQPKNNFIKTNIENTKTFIEYNEINETAVDGMMNELDDLLTEINEVNHIMNGQYSVPDNMDEEMILSGIFYLFNIYIYIYINKS